MFFLIDAPVAQLDRAFDYESKGRAFESLRVRHLCDCASQTGTFYAKCAF
jgi:hypothetical protein